MKGETLLEWFAEWARATLDVDVVMVARLGPGGREPMSTLVVRGRGGPLSSFVYDPGVAPGAALGCMGQVAVPLRDPEGRDSGVVVALARRALAPEREAAARELLERSRAMLEDELRRSSGDGSAEHRLFELERRESLAFLAGRLAHDFNNLLVGILGFADLGLQRAPEGTPANRHFSQIVDASLRAADLCQQMLAAAGRTTPELRRLDLGQVVARTVESLRAQTPQGCSLDLAVSQGLPSIKADTAHLEQVVRHLVRNAFEAIDGAGSVSVATGVRTLSPGMPVVTAGTPSGDYAYLEVRDDGCGIDPAVRPRIFEPFFSTKPRGRGLGLAATLGLARAHGGAVDVESRVSKGTTVTVYLPLAEATAGLAQRTSRGTGAPGSLLVADDDDQARAYVREALELAGYRVLEARDGPAAVALYREHAPELDGVLLDLSMPHMDGERTFRELVAIRSGVPVLLVTGCADTEAFARFRPGELAGVILKPFGTATLLERVRAALA